MSGSQNPQHFPIPSDFSNIQAIQKPKPIRKLPGRLLNSAWKRISMRSDKQNQASRNNGQKSQGPTTNEGKANSSHNSMRHNLSTGHLTLLSNEDPQVFHHHRDGFLLRFQPIDSVELDLVQKMIAATWRERRVEKMEAALFELEMARQQEDVDDEFEGVTPPVRQVLTLFGTTDATAAANLLMRYGAAARRAFATAYRILRDLQGDRFGRVPRAINTGVPVFQVETAAATEQPAETETESLATGALADIAQPAIVLRRREKAIENAIDSEKAQPENTKLPNEPKRGVALAAGQTFPWEQTAA